MNNTVAAAVDRYVHLATEGGLDVIDVADPRAPRVLPAAGTSRPTCRMAVDGHYAYMTTWAWPRSLLVLDLSRPVAPRLVAVSPLASYCAPVAVFNSLAFVAGQEAGLYVLGISPAIGWG
jgi:hypothetical protein